MSSIRSATADSVALGDELGGGVNDGAEMAKHVGAACPHRHSTASGDRSG